MVLILLEDFHHQFKYLVLHGVRHLVQISLPMLLELMEPCGDGEEIFMEFWVKIKCSFVVMKVVFNGCRI